jgi:hypothetical protein
MMRTVRLELARCHDFPKGSKNHGYELRVPLTWGGRLDAKAIPENRDEVTFHRFWGGEDALGHVRHGQRGWVLSFGPGGEADELIFRGDQHRFTTGEYVSIEERDGQTRTFRVTSVH